MATIADEMSISYSDITVVPARGGIGSQISTQADFVASRLAEKLGCQCRLMYLPDDLDYSTLRKLEKSTTIKEVLGLVKKADIILLGIGRADSMANAVKPWCSG
jgi:central glycolytic genes regulator